LGSHIHQQFADLGPDGVSIPPRTEPARAAHLDS
jgi:hypothetical protein